MGYVVVFGRGGVEGSSTLVFLFLIISKRLFFFVWLLVD